MISRSNILFAVLVIVALGVIYTHPALLAGPGGVLFGTVIVKDVAAAAQKYVTRAGLAGADYTAGVTGAGPRWAANSKAGAQNFAQGVQDAVTNGRYAHGIDKSGPANYEANATSKGAQRYPQGVAGAQQKWANNVAPYFAVIASANLPPRGPKGAPQNQQRSQMIADLLRKKKVSG